MQVSCATLVDFGGGVGANFLLNATLKNKRFAHAYLFCGEEFVGKRVVARKFAMAIFCCGVGKKPCCCCDVCKRFLAGTYVDYFEHSTENWLKSSTFTVQQVRQLISEAFVKPVEGQFKIFLISRVDKLLPAAANALLKLLEEPPENVIFLLTARSRFDVLQTIASRCFLVNVFGEGTKLCLERLKKEKFDVDEQKMKRAVLLGEGQFEKVKLILTDADWQMAIEISLGLFNSYVSKNELQFLKFAAKLESNSNLIFVVFKFFSVSLGLWLRKKLKLFNKFDLVLLKEAQRVLRCFEHVRLLILKNCNFKLAVAELCCSVFEN